jgi:hypothetical protein
VSLADGQQVEERLRRVLVAAVARVEDGTRDVAREEMAGPGRRMADDDRVRPHRLQVAAVSASVSPFVALDVDALMLIVSARAASRRSRTTCASACSIRRRG